jgi:hypothetical protein
LNGRGFHKTNKEILRSIKTIKLEIVSSSWRKKGVYNVRQAVKESLERVGFRIAEAGNEPYDAVLKIDYQEVKGTRCYVENRPYIPGDETIINLTVQLEHKTLGRILEREISARADPRITTTQKLLSPAECEQVVYGNALAKFKKMPTFNYLGELIALRSGSLLDKLKDDNPAVRRRTAQLFGEIRYTGAVEFLIASLQDEEPNVRKEAAIALGKIGDTRAIKPLQARLLTETNQDIQKSFEQVLKKLQH